MCSISTGLLSSIHNLVDFLFLKASMHNLVDFLFLEAYGLFFDYVDGKTSHKLPDLVKSGSGQDEKLTVIITNGASEVPCIPQTKPTTRLSSSKERYC